MENKTTQQKVEDIGIYFDNVSHRFIDEYEKKGLKKHTKFILEFFERKNLSNLTLLELGCGVGGLLFHFLDLGVKYAYGVDLSEKMIENAKILAKSKNYSEKTEFFVGDFNSVKRDVLPIKYADILVADRVLCCSPVPLDILKNMIGFNPKYIVAVQPRKNPLYKLYLGARVRVINFKHNVKDHGAKNPYVEVKEYDKVFQSHRYQRIFQRFRYAWEIIIYEKQGT